MSNTEYSEQEAPDLEHEADEPPGAPERLPEEDDEE